MSLAICVMARVPIPGQAKTRLSPPLTAEEAAGLAAAFLLDVWSAATRVSGAEVFLSYRGDEGKLPGEFGNVARFSQEGADLGARMEHTARVGLTRASSVLVIGSDLPGLSASCLQTARDALIDHDAVLGPSIDGGFYLIGLRDSPPGLLADLPWSAKNTHEATRSRLIDRGMRVAEAPRFDDVDTIDDVVALRNAIVAGSLLAPASALVLSRLTCV